jgi:hypothetical protein
LDTLNAGVVGSQFTVSLQRYPINNGVSNLGTTHSLADGADMHKHLLTTLFGLYEAEAAIVFPNF